jgi:hypothetical protein
VGPGLERDFVHVAALFSSAVSITHQPVKWVSEDASYTPGFLVFFKDGSQLVVEVKSAFEVEKCRPLFDRISAELSGRQSPSMAVTDHHLYADSRIVNALLILRYATTAFPADDCERALQCVNDSNSGISVADLCIRARVGLEVILRLVNWRRLALKVDLSFEPEDRVLPVQDSTNTNPVAHFRSWINARARSHERVEIDHTALDLALLRLASHWAAHACRPSQRTYK